MILHSIQHWRQYAPGKRRRPAGVGWRYPGVVVLLHLAAIWMPATAIAAAGDTRLGMTQAGILDRPLFDPEQLRPAVPGLLIAPGRPLQSIQREVRLEQQQLETLPRRQLETRAQSGERAAQVALGTDFAREAALLAFAPMAANAALSDAARWYSLAARRGFPGAPSLDQSGIRFYPLRIHRNR